MTVSKVRPPTCQECTRRKVSRPRGLCGTCYSKIDIREKHATNNERYNDGTPRCLHCTIRKRIKPRGLCAVCYSDPPTRKLYPCSRKDEDDHEPTEEELEQMIRENWATMPAKSSQEEDWE